MEKDIIDIVKDKEFFELNSEELAQLSDVCSSEEEFLQIKSVFTQLDSVLVTNPTPKDATKASLDELFAATHPKVALIWYAGILAKVTPKDKPIYRQPLMQLAAVALLLLLVVPLFNNGIVEPNQRLAKVDVADELGTAKTNDESKRMEITADKGVLVEEVLTEPVLPFQEQERIIVVEDLVADIVVEETVAFMSSSAPMSTHPDGVFIGRLDQEISNSISAVESSDLLDLLTTTF